MALKLKLARVPTATTRRYTMDGVSDADHPDEPFVFVVKSALEANTAYTNARFKALNTQKGRDISLATVKANRLEAIERYAKHVIVDWENVWEDGALLPCTPANVARVLTELTEPPADHPDLAGRPDLFDALTAFCNDVDNFSDERLVIETELGKLLPRG